MANKEGEGCSGPAYPLEACLSEGVGSRNPGRVGKALGGGDKGGSQDSKASGVCKEEN